MANNSRAVATRSSSSRRTPTTRKSGSKAVTNFKPINLRDISGYVDKAIALSKNPMGRAALKTILKQYASSTGIEENIFADAAMNFIDEVRTKSADPKMAKSSPNALASMIAGFLS